MITDIHTHHPAPQPHAIVNASPSAFSPVAGQMYSVGIHPWDTVNEPEAGLREELRRCAAMPEVAAIGECGIDIPKGGPLFRQMLLLKLHIELSECFSKPLILHDVKAHDIIIGLRRDMKPSMPWIVHGFRGKPQAAEMLIKSGVNISFGALFNPETVRSVPDNMILAETDESTQTISEIIRMLSEARGKDLTDTVASNTARLFRNTAIQI